MDAHDLVTVRLEGILNLLFIGIVRARYFSVRDEENFVLFLAKQFFVLITRKVQITGIVVAGA